jgi:hypothetical protein
VRRTRKWAFVAQEARRLAALGLTPLDISKRIDVKRSTVQRWMAAGKLTDTRRGGSKRTTGPRVTKLTKPSEWSTAVRKDYALDPTDDQLVTLAESALGRALDPLEPSSVRLSAMGRFQALVKQLALVARAADLPATAPNAAEAPARPTRHLPRRSSVDPRAVLVAVK